MPPGATAGEYTMAAPSLEHLTGRDIAGFRILSELGRGNNGVVYLARQLTLDREVALKLLLPELAAEPDYIRNILREARLAARLDHPNIVQALDAGSSPEGYYFFAMEYVPGETLEEIRVRRPGELTFRFLLDISIQLADALAYAWRHCQMIHGDIKPGNLLIRKGDRLLKLADLGLARISGAQGSDEIMVTPLYAAPEVIRGDFAQTGQTSDIYSFGVMFYELAAGRPPFRGDTDALIEAHLRLPPPPLAEVKPDVDPELAGFIMTMLEKDPEKRPGNWEEIGAFLRKIRTRLYNPGHTVRRPPHPGRKIPDRTRSARKRSKQQLLPAVLTAVAVAAISLLAGAFLYAAFRFLTEDTTLQPITITPQPPETLSSEETASPRELLKVALSGKAVREQPAKTSPQSASETQVPPQEPPPRVDRNGSPETRKKSAFPEPAQSESAPPPPRIQPAPPSTIVREQPEPRPSGRVFSPRVSINALRRRLLKLDQMLDQLNPDDFPAEWKSAAREVSAHAWLLLLQFATRGLPLPEPERFEATDTRRETGWNSFGGFVGFLRVYPQMPPVHIARGFGAGLYQELRKARRIPPGLSGDFARAFEFFVKERMGLSPSRPLENRVLRCCNYSLPEFVDGLRDGSLARRLGRTLRQK